MIVGVVVNLGLNKKASHLSFCGMVTKRLQMDKDYIIFQENGLFGAKNQRGEVVIQPQYMEMQPFSCGLSLVRNHQYQYAYIDILRLRCGSPWIAHQAC